MKIVYIEAYACGENGDGPQYAKLEITSEFIERLKKLQALCVEHGLSELRVYRAPEAWGPGDVEEELQLSCAELVVTNSSFWFTDYPKYGDYSIETRSQEIEEFVQAVSTDGDAAVFLGCNPGAVRAAVEENEENEE